MSAARAGAHEGPVWRAWLFRGQCSFKRGRAAAVAQIVASNEPT